MAKNNVKMTITMIFTVFFMALGSLYSAQGASAWSKKESYAEAKLVVSDLPGKNPPAPYLIGVHLKLAPGWKTYWRMPGDSGIPPVFDWSQSVNLKSAEILYPAPHRHQDASGQSIIYDDEVVLPVYIAPTNSDQAVTLHLALSYGLCKDICVPAEATLKLHLSPSQRPLREQTSLVEKFLAQVPHKLNANSKAVPRVTAVKAQLSPGAPRLTIETIFPQSAKNRDLFVEAGDDFYMPMAKLVSQKDGASTYEVDLADSGEVSSLRGKMLTYTLVSSAGNTQIALPIQ